MGFKPLIFQFLPWMLRLWQLIFLNSHFEWMSPMKQLNKFELRFNRHQKMHTSFLCCSSQRGFILEQAPPPIAKPAGRTNRMLTFVSDSFIQLWFRLIFMRLHLSWQSWARPTEMKPFHNWLHLLVLCNCNSFRDGPRLLSWAHCRSRLFSA